MSDIVTWPLMKDNMTLSDRVAMAKFCLLSKRFTNGPKVREFENKWAEWVGSKHALYVSSGSTANYLLLAAVKEIYGLKDGDKVLVPACTWVTNINPVFQLGFEPIFCDVDFNSFTFNEDHLKYIAERHDIKVVFTTHLMGFPAPVERYKEIFPEAYFLDDVCESHGCKNHDGTKVGSNSLGATFSFYFGHHMSTIEGGMICTNDWKLYDIMRLKRSHGLARESDEKKIYYESYPHLNKNFLFVTDGYNFRNHELGAVLGLSQLKRLDKMIEIRNENYKQFVKILSHYNRKVHVPCVPEGISSFCFPLVFYSKELRCRFEDQCILGGIEYRPIIGGNLLRQPYLGNYKIDNDKNNAVDIIHDCGVYLGNNQFLDLDTINHLHTMLQKI